ncbi:hypothetical protein COY05_01435 [Candidatus Peregrinibacteria bacterium CG_4_10_14_0_2_um_filter_38_24]|nr:MAG: hypothetical protein COY05_01435 [Candidatus Peregrinibacteria bacterium CG_4_10_14_0_2_um_filter_38_24]
MKFPKNNLLIVITCLSLVISATVFAKSKMFTDANSFADWNKKEIEFVSNHGFITGYQDGSFMPNKAVTRAELAVIIKRTHQANENMLLNALIADSESKNTNLVEPYRSLITIAKASGISEETPENLQELTKKDIQNLPKGYNIWEGDGLGGVISTYYVNWKGAVDEGDGSIQDFWYGPYTIWE